MPKSEVPRFLLPASSPSLGHGGMEWQAVASPSEELPSPGGYAAVHGALPDLQKGYSFLPPGFSHNFPISQHEGLTV